MALILLNLGCSLTFFSLFRADCGRSVAAAAGLGLGFSAALGTGAVTPRSEATSLTAASTLLLASLRFAS